MNENGYQRTANVTVYEPIQKLKRRKREKARMSMSTHARRKSRERNINDFTGQIISDKRHILEIRHQTPIQQTQKKKKNQKHGTHIIYTFSVLTEKQSRKLKRLLIARSTCMPNRPHCYKTFSCSNQFSMFFFCL